MPGWIVQWYANVPAVFIVTGVLVEPGLMFPLWKLPPSCVALCVIESALRQATRCPTRTVDGFGAKEFEPLLP